MNKPQQMIKGLVIVSILFYVISLFLPAIYYKPSVYTNPKHSSCSAAQNGQVCSEFPFADGDKLHCGSPEGMVGVDIINTEKIQAYCEGWDQAQASTDLGYKVLFLGWAGIFVLCFAWLANVGAVVALISVNKKPKRAALFATLSLLLSVQSFFFHRKYLDEGFVKSLDVDRLGTGFYLWFMSLLLLTIATVFSNLKPKTQAP